MAHQCQTNALSLTGQALIFKGKNRWYSPCLTSDHSGEILALSDLSLVDTLIFRNDWSRRYYRWLSGLVSFLDPTACHNGLVFLDPDAGDEDDLDEDALWIVFGGVKGSAADL
jgi:hypothetical protein